MSTEPQRTCLSCGNEFSGAMKSVRSACFARLLLAELSPARLLLPRIRSSRHRNRRCNDLSIMSWYGRRRETGRVGSGAMGVTYKAFDVDLHRPVTLKVISERYLGDESAQLRFLREARASARLRHTNVASVLPDWAEPVKTTFTRWSS